MDRRTFAASLGASAAFLSVAVPADAATRKVAASANECAWAARMISQIRQGAGLPPVAPDSRLTAAAQYQARTVAARGSLDHGDFAGRIHGFGIRGTAAENLAAGVNDVPGVIALWQNSPSHYTNLLLPTARRIGLAHADASTRYWALVIG